MTEPPRPPGDSGYGGTPDPTSPFPPPASYQTPGEAAPGYPPPAAPQYGMPPQPPTSGAGAYPPPTSGGGAYPPPTSGGGAYPPPGTPGGYPPPTSGGGAYPPPGGGYPGGGYPPPGLGGYPSGGTMYGGGAPAGYANSEEKTWALVAHFGGAAGAFLGSGVAGWVAPLVALLAKGNQSPTVRAHAVAALNFQLLWAIITVVSWVLTCIIIGFVTWFAAWLIATIFGIIAGVKATNGEPYRYRMTINLIK